MSSQTSLIRSSGQVEAVVACMGLRMTWVEPASWKRAYGLIGKPKEDSRETALRLYPDQRTAHELRLKSKPDRAEALLLARYLQGLRL